MNTMNRKALKVLVAVALLGAAGAASAASEGEDNWVVRQAKEPGSTYELDVPSRMSETPFGMIKVPQTEVVHGHNFADDAYYNRQNGGVPAL